KAEGLRVVLVNSNPATIMTDPQFADATYVEPITPEFVAKVIAKERPDALLATLGGQTALGLAKGLEQAGVPILGTSPAAIDLAEDRGRCGELLQRLGYSAPPYATAHSAEEALRCGDRVGYPLLVRPSYVLGGRAMPYWNAPAFYSPWAGGYFGGFGLGAGLLPGLMFGTALGGLMAPAAFGAGWDGG
ncbi:MAG: hypothetical protein ACLGI6_23740, partial [Gammaproteobacteria bacterium]